MAHYGRRKVPGEKPLSGAVEQRAVLNRILRAQVSTVSPENGFVTLTYENMPSGGKYATVAPLWMSFPKSAGPAWGRFMPQESDLVKVGFGYDDKLHILGYDMVAGKSTIGDGESGWTQLTEQYEAAKAGTGPAEHAKFAKFTTLRPGEYDFMSSGGAYIHGSDVGRLTLAGGGAVSITMTKNDLRMSARAQLWTHLADDCEFRFGQVRRNNPATQLEEKVGTGLLKEYIVTLKTSTAPGAALDIASTSIGNVTAATGIPELTENTSAPIRSVMKIYNDAGVKVLSDAIDNLGNWEVMAPTAATGVTFDFSAGSWLTRFREETHNASVRYNIVAPLMVFDASTSYTINSPKISLGGAGSEANPLILTSIYQSAETSFATGLAAQVATLATAVATLAGGVAALGTVLTVAAPLHLVPVAGPMIASPGLLAGGTAAIATATPVIGIAGTVAGAAPAVASAFTAPYLTYLSKVSSTT